MPRNDVSLPSEPALALEQRELRLNKLVAEIVHEIEANKGSVRRLLESSLNLFSSGPREEIAHDWLVVHALADATKERLLAADVDESRMHTLATVLAYLDLAQRERDFAQAWSYVNLADAGLPLLVAEEEIDACRVRLGVSDQYVSAEMRKRLQAIDPEGGGLAGSHNGPAFPSRPDRHKAHSGQLARTIFWNVANRAVSLKLALWREVGLWLFLGLAAAITVAFEVTRQQGASGSDQPLLAALFTSPYLKITVLGFFGGGLSSFLNARQAVIDIPHYGLIKVYTILRMLLGAAGAFVFFIVIQWPGLLAQPVLDSINNTPAVFLSLGILAGFSERLFVGTLEKMAEKLSITDVEVLKQHERAGGPNPDAESGAAATH